LGHCLLFRDHDEYACGEEEEEEEDEEATVILVLRF
jgi:hypothetical protein